VKLREVAVVGSGSGFPIIYQGKNDGIYPFYKVSDMNTIGNEKNMSVANNYITEDVRSELRAKVFAEDSIIFPKVGAAIATNKKRILTVSSCVDNNVMVVTAKQDKLIPRYLYHLFQSINLSSFASSSNPPSMRKTTVEDFQFSLPPLNEQKKIATILDKVYDLKQSAYNVIYLRSKIIHSIYHSLMENRKNWPIVDLSEVAENLDSQRVPIKASERIDGPYPYYGANGQQGSVHDYIYDEPLILVAEDGGHFFNTERPIAYRINGKSWVNNHAHVLRCKSEMDISFLHYQLAYYEVRPYLTGSTRAKLNKGVLMKMPIVKPPMNVQKGFAELCDRINALSDISNLLDLNSNSLTQKLLS